MRASVALIVVVTASASASVPAFAQESAPAAPAATTPPATSDPNLTPDKLFERGKNLYEAADCAGALNVLGPLAVPGKLQDEQDQLKVHRMLGVCYALGDKQLEAAREFSSLLAIDPDYDLDAFHNPPAAVDIFTRQKDAMKAQLEELRRAREKAKQSQAEDKGVILVERNTVVRDVPVAVAFMPFGLAQAANGETALGVAVGAAQGVTLATTVVSFWGSMIVLSGEDSAGTPQKKLQDKATYEGFVYTELIAAMAFGVTYGFGVAEALWNREDRVVIEKKETKRALSPEEAAALKKQSSPSSTATNPATGPAANAGTTTASSTNGTP